MNLAIDFDITTATPLVIDTRISELEKDFWDRQAIVSRRIETVHYVVEGYRTSRRGWKMTDAEALATLDAWLAEPGDESDFARYISHGGRKRVAEHREAITTAQLEIKQIDVVINTLEQEYDRRPWSRFHQLCSNPDARIHRSRWCPSLHRSNASDLGWHPELSGRTEEDVVRPAPEGLGPVMCSKCFPSAPVEWRRDPKDLRVDPNACQGENKEPVEGTVRRVKNYSGVRYYGKCPDCGEEKLLKGGNFLPRHKKPKGK